MLVIEVFLYFSIYFNSIFLFDQGRRYKLDSNMFCRWFIVEYMRLCYWQAHCT